MNAKSEKSGVKIMRASDYFIREYGARAYKAWLRREAEIAAISKEPGCARDLICLLRAKSFRQMKADGARRTAVAANAAALPPRKIKVAA